MNTATPRCRRRSYLRVTSVPFGADEGHRIRGRSQREQRQDNSSVPVNQERNTRQRVGHTLPSPEPHFLPTRSVKRTRVNLLCLEAVAFLWRGGVHFGRLGKTRGSRDSAESPGTFPTAEGEDGEVHRCDFLPLCVSCDSGSSVRTG